MPFRDSEAKRRYMRLYYEQKIKTGEIPCTADRKGSYGLNRARANKTPAQTPAIRQLLHKERTWCVIPSRTATEAEMSPKRKSAGNKAAATRKRNAAKRTIAAEKAALTRKRRAAAKKAVATKKHRAAGRKAAMTRMRRAAASKAAATRAQKTQTEKHGHRAPQLAGGLATST